VSGEPESKHTPARVEAFVVAWQGFLLTRTPPQLTDTTWWSLTRGDAFLHYEMAGRRVFSDWAPWARRMTAAPAGADWLEYVDRATGIYRAAYLKDDRLEACMFLSPRPDLPQRSWVSSLFAKASLSDADRAGLLMGRPADASADAGPIVCSCFAVGRNVICKAIRGAGLRSTEDIGRRLRAGTNCGSCLPELRALLHDQSEAVSA
jgi:assimilatory nitrate reductase catalytic subunit